ncbi:hypothetical protein BC835DRAFT_1311388 [Cytidiella melzeri]|nr:hypothetical protein BC835DRAFT_1311388 [Cytidiella melzeri]
MSSQESAFELFVGPVMLLVNFAVLLFGVFSAQCYFYWFAFGNDPRTVRVAVLLLWCCEAAHTSFCLHILYSYFVIHFGDPINGVDHIVWSTGITFIFEMIIITIVQSFYIHRIYRLSHSLVVAALPVPLLALRVGEYSVERDKATLNVFDASLGSLFIFDTWTSFRSHAIPNNMMLVSLSVGVATDIVIAGLVIYYLRQQQSTFARAYARSTKHIILRLQRNTVNNGAVSVVMSIFILVTLHAVPNSLMFGGFATIVGKIYANSMLATLNGRRTANKVGEKDSYNNIQLSIRQDTHTHTHVDRSDEGMLVLSTTANTEDACYRKAANISVFEPDTVKETSKAF